MFHKFNNVKYANTMRQLGHASWKKIKSTYILSKITALSNHLHTLIPIKTDPHKRIHCISSYQVGFTPPRLFFFGEFSMHGGVGCIQYENNTNMLIIGLHSPLLYT